MYVKRYLPLLIWCLVSVTSIPCLTGGAWGAGAASGGAGAEQLQEQMLGDPEIMSIIQDLQSDPQMQGMLSDPKVMDAVMSGDVGYLLRDPRFRKLLDSKQVKDIGKKLEKQNPAGLR